MPTDLVSRLGRREIVRALRASSYDDARRLAALVDARVWELFGRLRTGEPMTESEVERLIARLCEDYRREIVEQDRRDRRGDPRAWDTIDLLGDALGDESERLEEGRTEHLREDALRLLKAIGEDLHGDAFADLLHELLRTRVATLRQVRDERQRDLLGHPRESAQATAPTTSANAASAGPASPLFSTAIERYLEFNRANGISERTIKMRDTDLHEAMELIGDKPLSEISREPDVWAYRVALEKLPAHYRKRFPGKTAVEILTDPPADAEPLISPSTVRQKMERLHAFLRRGAEVGWVEKVATEGMLPPKARGRADEARDAFTDADLQAIFGPDYREKTLGKGQPERYWIPLLLLHTGARREEIAQLRVDDVIEEGGAWCINISGAEGRIKNDSSNRKTPLHSGLLSLGFLDYVEAAREEGHERLFHQLKYQPSHDGYGDAIGKWLGRWLRSHGVASRKKVGHSFRHTFTTRLKYADVQEFEPPRVYRRLHSLRGWSHGKAESVLARGS